MTPTNFKEQNMIYSENQEEYENLPAHHTYDEQGRVVFCMQLSPEEIQKVVETGVIWHEVLTFNQPLQPQRMSADKPEMVAPTEH